MKILSKITDKKRVIIIGAVLAFCVLGISLQIREVMQTTTKGKKATIVVDCGHGGVDPGKVGVGGSYEKDINLAIGLYLKEALKKEKCHVIMTRETDTGLYQDSDSNKKVADLNQRVEMMNDEAVDFIISIHQNSFTGANTRGAQVFYQTGSVEGEKFAKILQTQLISSLDTKNHRQAKANASYYLLKKTKKTAVIVECGFLSNSTEEQKLCDKSYQRQVAWAIAQGAVQYIEGIKQK